jgi:YVTN family beta-propeller protein
VQQDLATNDSQLVVLDGDKNTVLGTAPAGRAAWSLEVGLKANRVYVTGWAADGSGSLLVLDAAGYQPVQPAVPVGARPMDVAVDQATGRIDVANAGSNSVSVIDGQTLNVTTVPVGGPPPPSASTTSPAASTLASPACRTAWWCSTARRPRRSARSRSCTSRAAWR